ncbi:adenosine deaminase domain-containing protein 2 [Alligator mississippiensis]|uniref:Adenosine deaminase domain-containing protein 2 n=1 Tax=Alligator mississippiensis TaxID=8496 RepID=A0A151NSX9_ALLMI|nr:adenosine deaminase domain-containing protein 2 [Alligator mississippiensis]
MAAPPDELRRPRLAERGAGAEPSAPPELIPHEQRCVAIASDIFQRLLAGDSALQGCKSSLAAFLLEREVPPASASCQESYELVALGTGKAGARAGAFLEFGGRRLHDTQGLVLARRALQRYLYKQLLLWGQQLDTPAQAHCILELEGDGGRLGLKPGVFLHLVLAQKPSGAPSSPLVLCPGQQLLAHGPGRLAPLSWWRPAVLASRVVSISGNAKLLRWEALGLQGALLSLFLQPLPLTSLVLADPWASQAQLRAPCPVLPPLPPPYDTQRPAHVFQGPPMAPPPARSQPPALSLNWCLGDKAVEVVDGAMGRVLPSPLCPAGCPQPSRLCKAAMLSYFRHAATMLSQPHLLALPTYRQAKDHAEAYQSAKAQFSAHLARSSLGNWPQKQLVDNFPS